MSTLRFDLDDLGRLGWRIKAGLLSGWLSVLLLIGYGAHLRGVEQRLQQAETQVLAARAEQQDKQSRASTLGAQVSALENLQAALRRSDEALLDDGGLSDLVQDISYMRRGLVFEQMTVQAPLVGQHYTELPIELTLLGDFTALHAFVTGLSELTTLVTLHDLRLSPAEVGRDRHLRLQVLAKAYAKPGSEQAAPMAQLPAPQAQEVRDNPFQAPTRSTHGVLGRFSLDQLEWVGSLLDQRGRVALLRVAGAVHSVREGDVLGAEQARVVRIEEFQLELAEPLSGQDAGWSERSRIIGANAS